MWESPNSKLVYWQDLNALLVLIVHWAKSKIHYSPKIFRRTKTPGRS